MKKLYIQLSKKIDTLLHTNSRYIISNGFWLLTEQFLSMLFIFILSITYANFLPQSVYGTYKFILSIIGILGAFTLTGFSTAITQHAAKYKEQILLPSIKVKIKWSLIAMSIGVLVAAYYYTQGNTLFAITFLIAGILIPLHMCFNLYKGYLIGRSRFKVKSIFASTELAIHSTAMIITIIYTNSLIALIAINGSLFLILKSFFAFVSHKKVDSLYEKVSSIRNIVSYSFHLSIMKLMGTIANRVDEIYLFHYLGAVEVAVYTFAISLPKQIVTFVNQLYNLALPKFAKQKSYNIAIVKKIFQILLISIPTYFIYFLLSPYIFNTFFPTYSEAIPLTQLYALTIIFTNAGLPSAFIDANKLIKEKYVLSTLTISFKLIALIILGYNYGLVGVIAAKLSSDVFVYLITLVTVLMYQKKVRPTSN